MSAQSGRLIDSFRINHYGSDLPDRSPADRYYHDIKRSKSPQQTRESSQTLVVVRENRVGLPPVYDGTIYLKPDILEELD